MKSIVENGKPTVVTDEFVAGQQTESAASESQRNKLSELKRSSLNDENEKRGKTLDESRSTEQVKKPWRTRKGAALRKIAFARKDVVE